MQKREREESAAVADRKRSIIEKKPSSRAACALERGKMSMFCDGSALVNNTKRERKNRDAAEAGIDALPPSLCLGS